jgi:predicted nucleic acid-binding protein
LSRFVLDASVALSWFVDSPVDPYAAQVRDHMRGGLQGIVPQLWEVEFANGVLVAERRKIVDATVADESIAKMERLKFASIEVEAGPPPIGDVLTLARTVQLTAYDAVYLELARREGLPLATLDNRLKAAAGKAGVELLH